MKLILLMAVTLDGKIGRDSDHFPDWTGKADKRLFVSMTRSAGVMIMGSKTFDTIGKPLPGRTTIVMSRDKTRKSDWECLRFTDRSPEGVLEDLESMGFTEAILAGGSTINTLFAQKGLVNEIVVTLSPKIFGTGLSLFSRELDLDLELMEMTRPDTDLVCLRYRVL